VSNSDCDLLAFCSFQKQPVLSKEKIDVAPSAPKKEPKGVEPSLVAEKAKVGERKTTKTIGPPKPPVVEVLLDARWHAGMRMANANINNASGLKCSSLTICPCVCTN